MSETGLGDPRTDIPPPLPHTPSPLRGALTNYHHAYIQTYSVYVCVCVLGHGRCTPCRLRAAGDEMESAKPSATRKMAHRERPSTAGSGREIGATAHPTLPTAGNGRLGHVHVISSGSAGGRRGSVSRGMARQGREEMAAAPRPNRPHRRCDGRDRTGHDRTREEREDSKGVPVSQLGATRGLLGGGMAHTRGRAWGVLGAHGVE